MTLIAVAGPAPKIAIVTTALLLLGVLLKNYRVYQAYVTHK